MQPSHVPGKKRGAQTLVSAGSVRRRLIPLLLHAFIHGCLLKSCYMLDTVCGRQPAAGLQGCLPLGECSAGSESTREAVRIAVTVLFSRMHELT